MKRYNSFRFGDIDLFGRKESKPMKCSVTSTGSIRDQKSVFMTGIWRKRVGGGCMQWSGTCPGNSSQASNSQSFRLSRAVIFQHEREGTLETGALPENSIARGIDYQDPVQGNHKAGLRTPGLGAEDPGLEKMQEPGCRQRILMTCHREGSQPEGVSQRGPQEDGFTSR